MNGYVHVKMKSGIGRRVRERRCEGRRDRRGGREGRKRQRVRKGRRETIREESGQGGRNRFLIYSQFHHLYRGKVLM